MAPDRLLQGCDLTLQRARELRTEAAALCESSQDLIDTSFRLMELGDMKQSRHRAWLQALEALSYGMNGQVLTGILDLAIETSNADFGNIQVYDASERALRIIAQRGFEEEFLRYFANVGTGTGTCGTAMKQKSRVIVCDVANNPIFQGEAREIMLRANALACQSTPLICSCGRVVGMLSTHYRTPRRTPSRALPYLDLLAQRTADLLCPGD